MAGYSGTPLVKKLGIKDEARLVFVDAPPGFHQELGTLPTGALLLNQLAADLDFALYFVKSEKDLHKNFRRIAAKLKPNGMLWISWPKKASGVATDLSENVIRRIGLAAGLVDVKVCAVNEIWSGLKFVYRLQDRKKI
jgi:GTPase Era involved in 16S rRNA processing